MIIDILKKKEKSPVAWSLLPSQEGRARDLPTAPDELPLGIYTMILKTFTLRYYLQQYWSG